MSLRKPLERGHTACNICGPQVTTLPLDALLHPGFGAASLLCDDVYVRDAGETTQLRDFERLAAREPARDWQIRIYGPMHGAVYQRHGEAKWVLVETLEGFA